MEDKHFVLFVDILGCSLLASSNPADKVAQICNSEFRQTALMSNLISNMKSGNPAGLQFQVQTSPQGALHDIRQEQLHMHIMSDSLIAWTKDCSPESLLILSNFTAQFIGTTAILGLPLRGGISKGQVQVVEQPLNGNIVRNVFGSGVVAAHNFEGGQEWMGCVIDEECLSLFPENVANDLLTLPGTTLSKYPVPKKENWQYTSDVAVDWRSCLRETTPDANYEFFMEQFGRYNKRITSDVERKVRNTFKFYSAM